MPTVERVTVTLPRRLIEAIDEVDKNRSGFLAKAAKRELKRLRRLALRKALDARAPNEESRQLEQAGLKEWFSALPEEDVSELVDVEGGTPIRWVHGKGWLRGEEAK